MASYNGLIKKGWNVLKQSSLSQQVCRVCLMRVQAILSVVDYILDSGSSRLFRQFRAHVIPVPETCYHLVLMEVAVGCWHIDDGTGRAGAVDDGLGVADACDGGFSLRPAHDVFPLLHLCQAVSTVPVPHTGSGLL